MLSRFRKIIERSSPILGNTSCTFAIWCEKQPAWCKCFDFECFMVRMMWVGCGGPGRGCFINVLGMCTSYRKEPNWRKPNMPYWKVFMTRCMFRWSCWILQRSFHLVEHVNSCVRDVRAFQRSCKRGSKRWSELDPLVSDFQLCDSDRDRKEQEKGIVGYTSAKILLMKHLDQPRNINYGNYWALLHMWVE